ncbi:MAG TPA: hypothetical protein VHW65_11080 [Gemmatimonadales bacterium]|nr:hypothetical protein [Gemmatimonadales bacterium]
MGGGLRDWWRAATSDRDAITTDAVVRTTIWIKGYGPAEHFEDCGLLARVLRARAGEMNSVARDAGMVPVSELDSRPQLHQGGKIRGASRRGMPPAGPVQWVRAS